MVNEYKILIESQSWYAQKSRPALLEVSKNHGDIEMKFPQLAWNNQHTTKGSDNSTTGQTLNQTLLLKAPHG